MKKFIHWSISILVCLLMTTAVFAVDNPTFKATPASSSVNIGDTFTLSVSLENNPGFDAIAVDVFYDVNTLTCTGVDAGTVLSADDILFAGNANNDGRASTGAIRLAPITEDGTLFDITFVAKNAGKADISLEICELALEDNLITTPLEIENSIVTVLKHESLSPEVPEPPASPDVPEIPVKPELPTVSFSDVPQSHWAYTYVQNAVKQGLFSGIGNGMFGPGMNVTRGMFVTTLYSSAGSPDVELSDFSDVPADAWYARAVAWASQQGIVSGIGNNKFGPEMPITREQIALILYNYADGTSPGTEMFVRIGYPDGKDIHDWALTAFTWAMNKDLISGKSGNILDPLATATRAEVAVIMQNFVNLTK